MELATSVDEAIENILLYAKIAGSNNLHFKALASRAKRHAAWYAVHRDGNWHFGPSKFIGYRDMTAQRYLEDNDPLHGSRTERQLEGWFVPVDPNSALGRELSGKLIDFLKAFGKTPNKNFRISVPINELGNEVRTGSTVEPPSLLDRIDVDPEICGGRPRIRGTRVRVSDVLELLASGAQQSEILADYPYLQQEDIAAALQYAARSVTHRVIWTG